MFKPILDRVLVRRIEPPKVADGFEVPEKYRQSESWGIVEAVGDGVVLGSEFVYLTDFVKVGDKVKYGEYTAERLATEDGSLFIIRIQDIRGVDRE